MTRSIAPNQLYNYLIKNNLPDDMISGLINYGLSWCEDGEKVTGENAYGHCASCIYSETCDALHDMIVEYMED